MDRAAIGKALFFCYLTHGSRTANRTDSLYQTVSGLVGNTDWGESLTVAACEVPGLNTSMAEPPRSEGRRVTRKEQGLKGRTGNFKPELD